MSNINKQELREAAERAESDNWGYDRDEFNEALTQSTVLALLDELEKMQAQSSKWCEAFHKAVSVGARYEERIAELEAREVVLPQPAQWDISEVLLDKAKVLKAIRDAGITVKGE